MRRRIPEYLAVCFALIICGSAVWAGEKPSSAKTGSSGDDKYTSSIGVNSDAGLVGNVTLDEPDGAPVPEATKDKITVAWKNGQVSFPDTNEKASGLRLQCSGNVMIEGKGITAKATSLDVTISERDSLKKAGGLSFRCAGGVRIEWKGITMEATELKYDGEKCVLSLSGDKSRPCILRQKNGDGTNSVLTGDQISLSPCSKTVNCVGMKEFRAVDTSPNIGLPGPTQVAPGYAPPGAYPSYSPPTR